MYKYADTGETEGKQPNNQRKDGCWTYESSRMRGKYEMFQAWRGGKVLAGQYPPSLRAGPEPAALASAPAEQWNLYAPLKYLKDEAAPDLGGRYKEAPFPLSLQLTQSPCLQINRCEQ